MSVLVDKILNGTSVREAIETDIKESVSLDTDQATAMVKDWLAANTYDYSIDKVEPAFIRVDFTELDLNGSGDKSYFIIKDDGRIYNSNGDDVIKLALNSYADSDEEMQKQIRKFIQKWY